MFIFDSIIFPCITVIVLCFFVIGGTKECMLNKKAMTFAGDRS